MTKQSRPPAANAKRDAELLELGKRLQAFYDHGYVNKRQALWFSFLKGAASGFGAFLGGTILIALLLWVLSFFEGFQQLKSVIESLQSTLQKPQ